MSSELLGILEAIEKEKGIPKETLLEALKSALLTACKKSFAKSENIEISIDVKSATIKVLEGGKEVFHPDFGRIAAQTAKQVIIQKIREAERETIFEDFSKKRGEIAVGNVHRIESRAIIVNLGRLEGILPAREQSPNDDYEQGNVIRAYVLEVKKTQRGPEVILSRSHGDFVKRLFELEVPEIHDGIVEIKDVAREAGSRTKMAVISHDEKIDSVGSCVGMRGQRVKNVVREIGGEKIDIVRWNEDIETYIRNALSPAELAQVFLYPNAQRAEILVADDQLSLSIGRKGQNVRLASKLTGWQLDIRPLGEKVPLRSLDGVGEKTETLLQAAGIRSARDLARVTLEDLLKIEGIGEKTAEKILASAKKALRSVQVKEEGKETEPEPGEVSSASGDLKETETLLQETETSPVHSPNVNESSEEVAPESNSDSDAKIEERDAEPKEKDSGSLGESTS